MNECASGLVQAPRWNADSRTFCCGHHWHYGPSAGSYRCSIDARNAAMCIEAFLISAENRPSPIAQPHCDYGENSHHILSVVTFNALPSGETAFNPCFLS